MSDIKCQGPSFNPREKGRKSSEPTTMKTVLWGKGHLIQKNFICKEMRNTGVVSVLMSPIGKCV